MDLPLKMTEYEKQVTLRNTTDPKAIIPALRAAASVACNPCFTDGSVKVEDCAEYLALATDKSAEADEIRLRLRCAVAYAKGCNRLADEIEAMCAT